MAVAFVQGKANDSGPALSLSVALTSSVTAGNLLVVGVYAFGETTSSVTVTDTLLNTYSKVLTAWQGDSAAGTQDFFNLYYCVSASGGSNTVKAQGPSSSGYWGVAVGEFSGAGTPTLGAVKGGVAANTTNPYNGASFTPSSGDLLIALMGDEGGSQTITAGSGWSLASASGAGFNNLGLIYVLSAASGSTHGIWGIVGTTGDGGGNVYMALTSGGGTPHSQTIAATQASSPAFVRGVGKVLTATQAAAAHIARAIAKALTATQGATPTLAEVRARVATLTATQAATAALSLVRTRLATLAATQGVAATLVRGVGKLLAATQASTALLRRGIGKGLAATQGAAPALTAIRVRLVALVATQAATATITRGIGKALSAAQGSAATLATVRARFISLAATQGATVTALALRVRLVALAATQASTTALRRGIGKSLGATQTTAAAIARAIAKSVAATQSSAAGLTSGRLRQVALAATQATAAALTQARTRVVALLATQGAAATLRRGVGKGLSAAQGAAAGAGRGIAKGLAVVQASAATLAQTAIIAGGIHLARQAFTATWQTLAALAGWGTVQDTATWQTIQFTMNLGATPVLISSSSLQTIGPQDSGVSCVVTIAGLAQGQSIASATASATVQAPGSSTPTPASSFLVGSPVISGNTITLTLGNGAQILDARYVITLAVTVGGTTEAATLPIYCRQSAV